MVFLPLLLKIKDIVRILRHRNRGLITKLRELWQKQTDMRHFVISQLLEKISIIAFCSGQPFFCSLALSRICALAEDVAVDARDVWGLPCNSSVFFAFEQFQSQRWIFMTTSIAVDEFIKHFSCFAVVGVSDHDPTEHRDLQHCYGICMGGTSYQSSMVVTFSSMVFWGSFPNPKPGNALFAGAIDNHCTPTKPDQFLGICKRDYVQLSRLTFWNVQLFNMSCQKDTANS